MADKERISRPTNGSNEVGEETNEDRITGGISAGSNTQLKATALAGKKHKEGNNKNEKSSDDLQSKRKP